MLTERFELIRSKLQRVEDRSLKTVRILELKGCSRKYTVFLSKYRCSSLSMGCHNCNEIYMYIWLSLLCSLKAKIKTRNFIHIFSDTVVGRAWKDTSNDSVYSDNIRNQCHYIRARSWGPGPLCGRICSHSMCM